MGSGASRVASFGSAFCPEPGESKGDVGFVREAVVRKSNQLLDHSAAIQDSHLGPGLRVHPGQFTDRRPDHERCDGGRHGIFGVFVAGTDYSPRMRPTTGPE